MTLKCKKCGKMFTCNQKCLSESPTCYCGTCAIEEGFTVHNCETQYVKVLPIDHPEYKDQQRRKIGANALTGPEKFKILEFLKTIKKLMPLEDIAKMHGIPWYRQHQIYLCLKDDPQFHFVYYKGEWFMECQPQVQIAQTQ